MKAKKGQILILVLILMAVGLIVMAPLLHYMDTSYNIYQSKYNDTMAYYTIDAMMGNLFIDMYAGENIYMLNRSDSRYNPAGEWLNGYNISTSVNNSMPSPPPASGGEHPGFTYLDPGCSFGLNTLPYGQTYVFNVSLTEGDNVTVNWYFKDSQYVRFGRTPCNYYCIGNISITYRINGSIVTNATGSAVTTGNKMNGVNTAFQQQLNWTVPQGGSDIYSIKFKNLAQRGDGFSCGNVTRSMSQMFVKPTFSGIGDPLYTWVRTGDSTGYQYQDYTITSTASRHGTNVASVTACVRQTPGPSHWSEQQSLAVISWTITYY